MVEPIGQLGLLVLGALLNHAQVSQLLEPAQAVSADQPYLYASPGHAADPMTRSARSALQTSRMCTAIAS
jgi:hypothetical protein